MKARDNNSERRIPVRTGAGNYHAIIVSNFLLGPAVAWLVALVAIWIADPWWPSQRNGSNPFPLFVFFGLPASYALTGLQAVTCGIASAEYHSRRGNIPVIFALTMGILCSLAAMLAFKIMEPNANQKLVPGTLAFIAAAHVLMALVCWHVTKRYWKTQS